MQLGDYFEITSTSGHINKETFRNNEKEVRCYTYDKEMTEDSFIHLIAAGSFSFQSTCAFTLRAIPCYHFFYIYEGIVEILTNGETYTGQPGHLLFLSPSDQLEYHIKSGRCRYFQAILCGAPLDTYRQLLPGDIPYSKGSSGASCLPDCIGHLLHHVPYNTEIDTIMFSKWSNDIFTELCVYAADSTRLRDQIPPHMIEMKELFDNEFQEPYTLEELEHRFDKSRYRLCREFSQYFGESPIQYLNHRRIREAKILLLSTNMAIHEVGSSVGIDNTNHFINLFKKETGATPLVFKQEAPVSISELHYPYAPDVHQQ